MNKQTRSKGPFVAAFIIKFGLLPGVAFIFLRLLGIYLIFPQALSLETVAITFFLALIWLVIVAIVARKQAKKIN